MAQKDRAVLIGEINTLINTNGTQAITGGVLNGVLLDLIDSFLNLISDEERAGLLEHSESVIYNAGETMYFDGKIYAALSGSTAGVFNPAQWVEISSGSSLYSFPVYDNATTYALDDIIREDLLLYISLSGGNVGNLPSANPGDWAQINPSDGTFAPIWSAALYDQDAVVRYNPGAGVQFYQNTSGGPLNSSNITTEIAATDWTIISDSFLSIVNVFTDSSSATLAAFVAAEYTVGNEFKEGDSIILTIPGEVYIHNGGTAVTVADFTKIEHPALTDSAVRALFTGVNGLTYNNGTGEFKLGGSLTAGTTIAQGAFKLTLSTAGNANTLVVDPAGKVAVGLSVPLETMHVNGNARIDGNHTVNGLGEYAYNVDDSSTVLKAFGNLGNPTIFGQKVAHFYANLNTLGAGANTILELEHINPAGNTSNAYNSKILNCKGGVSVIGAIDALSVHSWGFISMGGASLDPDAQLKVNHWRGFDTNLALNKNLTKGLHVLNVVASTGPASFVKYGVKVESTGTFQGGSSVNYGIHITATGGDENFALYAEGDISVNGDYIVNGNSGFTGTGAYTNFTIEGGIITAAS